MWKMAVLCWFWLFGLICSTVQHVQLFNRLYISYGSKILSLKMQKFPAVFGQNFTMWCEIKSLKCNDSRHWYGGRHFRLLCEDGRCLKGNKYTESILQDCSFMLTISNLSENDLNCYYGCQYGFNQVRKKLILDDSKFRYFPTNNDIDLMLTTTKEKLVKLKLNVKKVFPKPVCYIDITETDQITVLQEVKKQGIFYQMSLNAAIPQRLLPGCNVMVVCEIGERNVTIVDKKLLECNSKDFDRVIDIVVAVVVSGILVVMILILSYILYCTCCSKDRYMSASSWKICKKNCGCINSENREQIHLERDNNSVNTTNSSLHYTSFQKDDPQLPIPLMPISTDINSVDTSKQLEASTVHLKQTIAMQNVDSSITEKECDDDNFKSYPNTANNLKVEIEPLLVNVKTQCKMDTSGTVDGETLPLPGHCPNMPTISETTLIENVEPSDINENKPVSTTTNEEMCLINCTSIPHCNANNSLMIDAVEEKVIDMTNQLEASPALFESTTHMQKTDKMCTEMK